MMQYQCLVFISMLLIAVKGITGTIPLEINAGGETVTQYPVAVGVPFPEDGECLDSISSLKISKVIGGEEVPFQVHELCKWKNGKIKAALVQFLADIGDYKIDYGVGISKGTSGIQAVNVKDEQGYVEVNTGVLRFRINKNYGKLFDGIWLNGEKIVESGDMEIIGIDGTSYKSSNYSYSADEVKIEERGPVRSCIMIRGKYVASNNSANNFRYIVRVYAYAGKGFLQISHTIIDEDSTINREVRLKGYNIQLKHLLPNSTCRLGKEPSGYHEKQVTEECYAYQGTSTSYNGNIGSGTHASGWIDINNGNYGIIAAVRHFWQNYPKGFAVTNEMLKIWLFPDTAKENLFGGSGIAKTHNLMLCFNSGGFNQDAVEHQVSLFRYNIFPRIPSKWYCDSGVFGKILPGVVGDSIPISTNYGYKKFGDSISCHRYVEQDPGNQELLYYIQDSSKKEYFDIGERRFYHAADMHIIHAGYGQVDAWGQYTWGQKSVRGGCRGYETGCGALSYDDRRHAQVAGAGVYYLLTGDKWAEEVIRKCGDCRYENLVNIPDGMSHQLVGVFQEREAGVTLWRALQAYNATGERKYLVAMSESVKGLVGNQKRGFWMQHQSSSGPRFLGKGYYWDHYGNYCKYESGEWKCKIGCPWMSAYLFAPLVEYDKLNKYYNLIDTLSVEDMLIGCMEHLIKYTGGEKNGRIGFRREGCMDWEVDYLSCRLVYPVVYLRKLSGNQNWDRLIESLLDKTWSERVWFYSESERMYQEYQQIGIKDVKIDTSKNKIVNISWVNNSEGISRLIYGTRKFDGNVKNGVEYTVLGNSCELNNLMPGTVYYFQFITSSGKRTWMYTFKTKGGIDDVNFTNIGDTYVEMKWTTDFNGNSIIEYATDDEWLSSPGQYLHSEKDTREMENHTISLTGLKKATGYHVRVISCGEEYAATSDDNTFSTEGGVSGINAYPVDENSAVITFLTWPGPYYLLDTYQNPIENVAVYYGTSRDNLFNFVKTDFGGWGVVLRRLQANTVYYYQVKINNRWIYPSIVSPIYTFFTQKGYEKPSQGLLCDFGRKGSELPDGQIDFEDLMLFTVYWNAYQANPSNLKGDIAGPITTTSGYPPNIQTQPDGKVDFEDLMIFVKMWNWFKDNG